MVTRHATVQPAAVPDSGRQWIRRHPLLAFFIMAYVFSWVVLIPFILSEWNLAPKLFTMAFVLNPFVGPAMAALIVIGVTQGKAGVQGLVRRCLLWRVGWQWYLFSLLGIPLFFLLGILVLPGALSSFYGVTPSFLVSYLITYVVIFFLGGPLGEEIGWRGFALPRLQSRYGPLWGTMILGVLWVFWHLPHFLTSAQRGGPGMTVASFLTNLSIFFVMVLCMSVLFTWVFNHTQGSVLMAMLLHASINTFSIIVPLFDSPLVTGSDLPILLGVSVPTLVVLLLTRGRLGYTANAPLS